MSILDFYAMATFHLFAKGERYSNVQTAARYDHLYANTSRLVTFLDNHDFGPNNDWNRRYGGNAENLAAALNFMWTWRGIPSLYYGTEMQFMRGAYTDIQYGGHQRSLDETGRAYFGDVMDEAPNHVIYQHLKKLNAMRRAIPALQKGTWRWGGNGGENGVGIVREANNSYAVVGLAKDAAVNFNFTGIRNGIYRDAVTGHQVTVTNGSITFSVAPSSAGVYVLNGPGRIGDLGAGFFQRDSAGSQGGGGGTTQPGTVYRMTPDPPRAGQNVRITYQGSLQSASAINLHWGRNGWQYVTTTAMTRVNGVWTLDLPVPAGTTMLDFVFNNGSGAWDNNGGEDYHVAVMASTSIEDDPYLSGIELHQNHPNPFTSVTSIGFTLSAEQHVRVSVYDVLGREVVRLADDRFASGSHEVLFEAEKLPSGVYLYRMEAGDATRVRRMFHRK
jgi:hypothetical protein